MSTNSKRSKTRYEVITQETPDGDVIIPVPLPLLKYLGWKEGDNVEIGVDSKGELFLKKANK